MIKKLSIDNLNELLFIENNCFSHPLSENNLRSSLLNEKYYTIGFYVDSNLIGYGSVFLVADEAYINNIAVLSDYRKQGIASAIVNELCKFSETQKCNFITLEVRESNTSAISLYNKLEFAKVGVRKKYYNQPTENAIIMTKYFGENL